jgi:hypothetical protein
MALTYALLRKLLSTSLGGATIACVEELCILLALVLYWDILRKNKMIDSQAALLVSNPVSEQPERTGPFTHYLLGMGAERAGKEGISVYVSTDQWDILGR